MADTLPTYIIAGRPSDGLGHNKGIACLALSANGLYLASGIWDVVNQKLQHVVRTSVAVVSLDWEKRGETLLLCGLTDGTVAWVVITPVSTSCSLKGYTSHTEHRRSSLSNGLTVLGTPWSASQLAKTWATRLRKVRPHSTLPLIHTPNLRPLQTQRLCDSLRPSRTQRHNRPPRTRSHSAQRERTPPRLALSPSLMLSSFCFPYIRHRGFFRQIPSPQLI